MTKRKTPQRRSRPRLADRERLLVRAAPLGAKQGRDALEQLIRAELETIRPTGTSTFS